MCGCYGSSRHLIIGTGILSTILTLLPALFYPSFPGVVNYTTCVRDAGKYNSSVRDRCIRRADGEGVEMYIFLISTSCLLLAIGIILAVFRILVGVDSNCCLAFWACVFVNAGLAMFSDMLFVACSASLASHRQKGSAASCYDSPSAYSFGSKSHIQYYGFAIGWATSMLVGTFININHELSAKIVLCCLGAILMFVSTFLLSAPGASNAVTCNPKPGVRYDAASYVLAVWTTVLYCLMYWHCYFDFTAETDTDCGCCTLESGCCCCASGGYEPPPARKVAVVGVIDLRSGSAVAVATED